MYHKGLLLTDSSENEEQKEEHTERLIWVFREERNYTIDYINEKVHICM